ncbi:hypothetical protein GCM10020000_57800 [Streptomyces olivoverticillatus]
MAAPSQERSGWRYGHGGAASEAAREELLLASAAAGFPPGPPAAHPSGYGCSCERIGCPTPGRHPVSFAWQTLASTDADKVTKWLRGQPEANFVTATGIAHDVLDVPAEAGSAGARPADRRGDRRRSGRHGRPPAACSSSPPPAAPRTTRTSGGPASWTAIPRRWTSIRACAGTAAAAMCCCRPPSSRVTSAWPGCSAPSARCRTR